MEKKKNIGGPGYTGSYVVVVFKNGERKFIENSDTDPDTVTYIGQHYDNVASAHGFEKPNPFESAQEVSRYNP